ncbi:hypothetical protein [Streptomyces sp. NPDC089919]|uniref:hypothetical protein n=1 Tax=Streptomyces sp. NPDC089919 TaxID=3155188 RepID=UPI00343BA6C5
MRTSRILAAGALAAAALALTPPAAYADSASVSPLTVVPGGTITINVECSFTQTSQSPPTITATSQAFASGTTTLRLVGEGGMPGAGGRYRGTALIASTSQFTTSATTWSVTGSCPGGSPWSAGFTVTRQPNGTRGGLGGSFTPSTGTTLAGAGLAAAALGGTYWHLRRRNARARS